MGSTHSFETKNEKREIHLAAIQRKKQLQVKDTTRRATKRMSSTRKKKMTLTPAPSASANPWATEYETSITKGVKQHHSKEDRFRNRSHNANDTYHIGHGDPCGQVLGV